MYKIVTRRELNPTVTLLEIDAPLIAKKAEPGQPDLPHGPGSVALLIFKLLIFHDNHLYLLS